MHCNSPSKLIKLQDKKEEIQDAQIQKTNFSSRIKKQKLYAATMINQFHHAL